MVLVPEAYRNHPDLTKNYPEVRAKSHRPCCRSCSFPLLRLPQADRGSVASRCARPGSREPHCSSGRLQLGCHIKSFSRCPMCAWGLECLGLGHHDRSAAGPRRLTQPALTCAPR